VAPQSFGTSEVKKELLLINKSNATATVTLPEGCSTTFIVVDDASSENPRVETISNGVVTLALLVVGVVGQPHRDRNGDDDKGHDRE
jgi:hypothetical protein